jgi:hypothetical protein
MEDGAKRSDLEDRTFHFARVPSCSGEHRLPACSFRQLAEKLFERSAPLFCSIPWRRRQAADDCRPALPRI